MHSVAPVLLLQTRLGREPGTGKGTAIDIAGVAAHPQLCSQELWQSVDPEAALVAWGQGWAVSSSFHPSSINC